MAYEIIGTIFKIGQTESLNTKRGGTLNKRTLVLIQRRFDNNGQEFQPNYPTLEFTNSNTTKLDGFKIGDRVRVRFDVNGTKTEKNGQDSFFSSLRGFHIEQYVAQQPQPAPQPAQNYPPQGGYPPQGAYPPQQGGYPPPQGQQPYYPPQQPASQPFPPQPQGQGKDGLPF